MSAPIWGIRIPVAFPKGLGNSQPLLSRFTGAPTKLARVISHGPRISQHVHSEKGEAINDFTHFRERFFTNHVINEDNSKYR